MKLEISENYASFVKHLRDVHQDYMSHCKNALNLAYDLQCFALQAACHALLPNLCPNISLQLKEYVKSL